MAAVGIGLECSVQDEKCRESVGQTDFDGELWFDGGMQTGEHVSLLNADFGHAVELMEKPIASALGVLLIHSGELLHCRFQHFSVKPLGTVFSGNVMSK